MAPLLLVLAGCQSLDSGLSGSHVRDTDVAMSLEQEPDWLSEAEQAPQPAQDIWERMRLGFQLQDQIGVNPRIEHQRLWFASNPAFLQHVGERGSLYIHYVVERLEERDMPLELALLPAIESAYNPFAYSRSHAVGLWQFIPSTGRYFNLRQTNWYDGRRDITASTTAAMNYLSKLHDMFNGDWLLALAAYNAGEGTVSRAIERNQKLGLPTDYWNLPLPKETQDYVPKLLALSQMVLSPEAYGISLNPIANEPYFEQIAIHRRMDLSRIAKMADLDVDELYRLNPAFTRRITMDGPNHLLVPADKAELLTANLPLLGDQQLVDWQEYRVRSGDSLHAIAYRNQLTVAALKELNNLKSNNLRVGQLLSIPTAPGSSGAKASLKQVASAIQPQSRLSNYRVKSGDTLWTIAREQRVTIQELQRWNKLQGNNLKIGQVLAVRSATTAETRAALAKAERDAATYYRVRSGDSLALIAKRFKIDLSHLQRWNPRSDQGLKPGQMLTLYLP